MTLPLHIYLLLSIPLEGIVCN